MVGGGPRKGRGSPAGEGSMLGLQLDSEAPRPTLGAPSLREEVILLVLSLCDGYLLVKYNALHS